MSNVIVAAFMIFQRAHRNASDSLERRTKRPAEIRIRLIEEAGPSFKKLDEKTRKVFTDSLLSNQLLNITAVQADTAVQNGDFAILLPIEQLPDFLPYMRHARKRALGIVEEALQAA